MLIYLDGYQILQQIQAGQKAQIYRGFKQPEKTPVILKILKSEYPNTSELARLRHEYKITAGLNLSGIIKSYALERYQNGLALILEDIGGESLSHYLESHSLSLTQTLQLGIQLGDILGTLHQNQIIHKDIKPSNIIISPDRKYVKITDFSISTKLARETHQSTNLNQLEGTLAYMSPEQTGRMNRSLDYRTDFYSLGVTFYEILTGQLPFQSKDPLELIHAHIAVTPVPPDEIAPHIPEVVSRIVMKLLAKNAEDRYQTAEGLKADLEIGLNQLRGTVKLENFTPGTLDQSSQFLIPQKLYGRESEVDQLLAAFERVAGNNPENRESRTLEMILVSGYSGIGKTSVVHEVHKPIVRQRGYFISGKFDQFQRHIPYAAISAAFSYFMQQLLTERVEILTQWQEKLQTALGENAQVIIDVIPELEPIIGKQPAIPQLGASETQHRFNRIFQKFIQVFTQKEHPLVIFLDDLQWADSASLNLIHEVMTSPESQYLLWVGAYRNNEVSAVHPTIQTLEKIQEAGTAVNTILLEPLGFGDVTHLIADTLGGTDPEQSTSLAQLMYSKTGGNPFFLTQLLETLYAEKLLKFNFAAGAWQWKLSEIQAVGITDFTIVELVAHNLKKLPEVAQNVLKLAACMGNQFTLDVLAIAHETGLEETAAQLWEALQSGLILPLSEAYKIPTLLEGLSESAVGLNNINNDESVKITYKFLHDRVQQAAYTLIPDAEKKQTHLKIGKLLLENTSAQEREENIFPLVNQLNHGTDLLTKRQDKEELASLNLIAGQKAKASTAYEAAAQYFNVGLQLLEKQSWQTQYPLQLALCVATIEAEYLTTHFERAQELSAEVLHHAQNILDRVKVYEILIQSDIAQNKLSSALETAIEAVNLLGIPLPKNPEDMGAYAENLTAEINLETKEIADLAALPEMTDPYQLAAVRILMNAAAPAYLVNLQLWQIIVLTMVSLSMKNGNSPQGTYSYVLYGLFLCAVSGNIEAGYQFGLLANALVETFNAKELKSKIACLFNAFIRPWKTPARETIPGFLQGCQIGLETGDIEHAGYAVTHCGNYLFFIGEPLDTAQEKQAQYLDLVERFKLQFAQDYGGIWNQLVLNLLGQAPEPAQLGGSRLDVSKMLPIWLAQNNLLLVFCTYCCQTILHYLFKEPEQAVQSAQLGEQYQQGAAGFLYVAEHNFYYSLALLARYPGGELGQQTEDLEKVAANQQKMQHWASHAPANFQHKYELVAAEIARVQGEDDKAVFYYDAAIAGAKKFGYLQEEALASELAAEFYFSRGRNKLAQLYLLDAYYGYMHWGAHGKVQELESRYSDFFQKLSTGEMLGVRSTHTLTSTTTTGSGSALDTLTIVKVSQALSEEIVLDKLLQNLLQILMENAGATKGLMFMKKSGTWVLAADKSLFKENNLKVLPSVPINARPDLPGGIVDYVERTQKTVVLNDATVEGLFTSEPYILKTQPKSILCMPLTHQGKESGILYLENHLTAGTFTLQRLEVLKLLCVQASISLENAGFYEQLQEYSQQLEKKNAALQELSAREREKADKLAHSLHELQQTQAQLVQTEKISSLGQLVAGVAHEVNNPVGFISGNLTHSIEYVTDLLELVNLYQNYFPNPPGEIAEKLEDIELEFIKEDLPELLKSMTVGIERIKDIMQSLRDFSRVDAQKKPTDINGGLDSTLMILTARLKGKGDRPQIKVIKDYKKLPQVTCFGGQLNQVFMNIVANAIDAIDAMILQQSQDKSPEPLPYSSPTISIRTQLEADGVVIRIADNGPGMPEEVRDRLFNAFFTTKPEGKGTGLGMSISHQIVVEKHGGSIRCVSAPGEGTEFIIKIPLTPQTQEVEQTPLRQSSR